MKPANSALNFPMSSEELWEFLDHQELKVTVVFLELGAPDPLVFPESQDCMGQRGRREASASKAHLGSRASVVFKVSLGMMQRRETRGSVATQVSQDPTD